MLEAVGSRDGNNEVCACEEEKQREEWAGRVGTGAAPVVVASSHLLFYPILCYAILARLLLCCAAAGPLAMEPSCPAATTTI